MKKCEVLLGERSKLKDATSGKKIMERKKIENTINSLLEDIRLDIKEMEKELKHQRKYPQKFPDVETKSEILNLLVKKKEILKSKYEDAEYNEDEYSQNEEKIQTLEQFLNKNNTNSNAAGRELYEEEENKIGMWKNRVKEQDEQLDEIRGGVGRLKNEAKIAGKRINNIGKKVGKVSKHVDNTHKSVNSQNSRLKELIAKFRSADKYCCDIILILIFIGLVCTLYSIIKHKF
jgi:chromosome segregation ATPase